MKKIDVIREVESMLDRGGYQVAKAIVELASQRAGTFKRVGKSGQKRDMSQEEAARIVLTAKKRIELVDSGG